MLKKIMTDDNMYELQKQSYWSFSRANQPNGYFLYWYGTKTAEERRQHVIGESGQIGSFVHEGVQLVVSHGLDITQAIATTVAAFDSKFVSDDDVKRSRFREMIDPMICQAVDMLGKYNFTKPKDELKIECHLPDIDLPFIGYVDLVGDGMFCEMKTKSVSKSRVLKDGTQGWSKGRLPTNEPDWSHVKQVALYHHATKLIPSIMYIAEHEAKIFTPFNCERLGDAMLATALDELRKQTLIKQNLIKISPDPKVLAGLVDPDWQHMYIWNDDQQREEAKRLWQI